VSQTTLDEEAAVDVTSDGDGAWSSLLSRLNRQSVDKHFDAYADVAWDSPEFAIDPDDPRWELGGDEPLSQTDWYKSQPAGVRSRIGLQMVASKMKTGLQFESVLKRGLLEFAFDLPNNSAEFRYAYHEVIEEAQHSLMFQEFVNRSGFDVKGLGWMERLGTRRIVKLGRRFPELFFVFVLGGEDPIDDVQRKMLRNGDNHPLLERIMKIHVTEEARHLSFARHYLKRTVPQLPFHKRVMLMIEAPIILSTMAAQMLAPPRQVVRQYDIPKDVVRAAYKDNAEHRAGVAHSVRKLRGLLDELGLIPAPIRFVWRKFGLMPA
jgi:hypothetical protein